MLSLAFSAAMLGIEGYVVRVEADSSAWRPSPSIIASVALGENGMFRYKNRSK